MIDFSHGKFTRQRREMKSRRMRYAEGKLVCVVRKETLYERAFPHSGGSKYDERRSARRRLHPRGLRHSRWRMSW